MNLKIFPKTVFRLIVKQTVRVFSLLFLTSVVYSQIKLNLVNENLSFELIDSTFTEININTYQLLDEGKGNDGYFTIIFGTMSMVNTGDTSFDVWLAIISTTTKYRIVTSTPTKSNEFRFYSIFSTATCSEQDFSYDDILSTEPKVSSVDTFARDDDPQNVKGYDVSSGSTRTLFFRLDISTTVTTMTANFCLNIEVKSSQEGSEEISWSNGGVVSIVNRVELKIPSGGLNKNETISILEKPKDNFQKLQNISAVMVYEFFPKGLVFRKPAKLTYYYKTKKVSSEDEDKLRIYYWDGYEWRYVGGVVDKETKSVSCYISHFSVYGLFPAITLPTYKPLEKIITPALKDGINDVATFDGLAGQDVTIKIFDITGRQVRSIDVLKEGNIWDGKDVLGNIVESGVYIYQFEYNGKKYSGTIVVAK
jgi:hypothetical protein